MFLHKKITKDDLDKYVEPIVQEILRKNAIMRIIRLEVESSNIYAIGYNTEQKLLDVQFKPSRDKFYRYQGISNSLYDNLMNAPSIGSFYAKKIKGKFIAEIFEIQ